MTTFHALSRVSGAEANPTSWEHATCVGAAREPPSGSRPAPRFASHALDARVYPGRFQPIQLQRARPLINSLSRSDSHESSSVNIVTHCRQEQGMRVISVPQNIRSGPKAS